MDKNAKHYPLNVTMPQHCAYVVRDLPQATVEQRERALNATHWNEFAFPSGMLTVDMLSDSGTTAMTNQQWATLFLGDEAYGRNTGYYVLLDTFRDIFERGGEKNWKKVIDLVRTDCRDIEKMMDEVYLCEYEGGLFNGGAAQMERPNAFIIQQGRAAESVLMEIVKKILAQRHPGKVFTIPSNGHFDTTEGNIKQMGSIPRNLYNKELLYEIPEGGSYEKNPFKGNMDIEKLEQLIQGVGPENVPLVFTCITNNPICGQPVSMANLREVSRICQKYGIPLCIDAARYAENAMFIKQREAGYADKSIPEIVRECFSYADMFTMSAKKDTLVNMGGVHVSLEGGDQLGVLGFLADALQRSGTGEHHMAAGGVKKQVGQGVGSWVQKVGKQDLFGRPALVYRAEKAVAEHVLTGLDKTVVALRAGVGLVAPQEPRPHLRTHGVGAGVRQGVDVDILPLQAEQVVARLPDLVTALFSGQHFDVFHHFNAERLGNVLGHA